MTEIGYNPFSEEEIIFLNFRQDFEGLAKLYVLKKEDWKKMASYFFFRFRVSSLTKTYSNAVS